MKLLIHDGGNHELLMQIQSDSSESETKLLSPDVPIRSCFGCFGCWVKTPAACVIKDDYQEMGRYMASCDELILVSRCCYGGFSPYVKNVLDRSISYILPYFELREGEMHHKSRYEQRFALTVHFYGDQITPQDEAIARKLVHANGLNFHAASTQVFFHHQVQNQEGVAI
jgi:multimeric flavodoxin WrbA